MINELEDVNISKAMAFMRDNAAPLAKAKADRIYLEQFRKSKKAQLQNDYVAPVGVARATDAMRESYAYAHPDYIAVLDGLKVAVEIEEELKWKMKAAETKTEIWRTLQANNRRVDAAHT